MGEGVTIWLYYCLTHGGGACTIPPTPPGMVREGISLGMCVMYLAIRQGNTIIRLRFREQTVTPSLYVWMMTQCDASHVRVRIPHGGKPNG
jgi:hypothetical protein